MDFFVYLNMAKLDAYIKALENLIRTLPSKVDKYVHNNSNYFTDSVQNRLYDTGTDGDGRDLGSYSLFYKNYKIDIGAVSDHITLFNEGDFYDDMFVASTKGKVRVSSSNSKTGSILQMFTGFDIFGFTEKEQEFLIENVIMPDLIEDLKKLPSTITIEIS